LARQGKTKEEIKDYVIKNYYPRLIGLSYDLLLKYYQFDVSCQGSVPEAIFSFLISQSLEDAIKTAISLGGDSDTLAAMAGSIAEAYYQSEELSDFEQDFLDRVIDLHDENLIIQLHTVIHSPKFLRNRDI
jgi:type I restriction enzyme M protein